MVSLRRRRLLGLCSGVRNSFLAPFPRFCDNVNVLENALHNTNRVTVHPMTSANTIKPGEDAVGRSIRMRCDTRFISWDWQGIHDQASTLKVNRSLAGCGFGSGSSKDQSQQTNVSGSSSSKEQRNQPSPECEIKLRKRYRRKNINNQEQCAMRGVYFKNMKWQAAIKVDKKQIHLGTVRSQEEAARLYDRAAFMCGREPNFELSDAEKKELKTCNWDEFLSTTRRSITSKKTKRRHGAGSQIISETSAQNDSEADRAAEDGSSSLDDAEQEPSIT